MNYKSIEQLNSHDNPKCTGCIKCKRIGCGTRIVNGKRKHIEIYKCTAKACKF